ncbi:AraC family transcriptional regulator [Cellulosimicrobium cellulans]|uniref:AraC family transcriptional regulator n=1 Tax=Cellulosimicrobium cellulans TaxID=1710 RepID=UPI0008490753|nr:helix-turn-helix domain-containing protein [Cellulosimicrobium cellulans]
MFDPEDGRGGRGGEDRATTSLRGLVDPAAARRGFALERLDPAPDLADLVERHWVVRWDLPPEERFTQVVVPHPVANVVAEASGYAAHGIPPGLFERTLTGAGVVVGTKLRPGAFRVLLGSADAVQPGVRVPASSFLGPAADDVGRRALALAGGGDERAAVAVVEQLLRARADVVRTPRAVRDLERVRATFAALVAGELAPGAGVGDLAAVTGSTPRSLQRLFAATVGVSPKWVLQRHRVHLAADLLAANPDQDLAALATAVGYYDQAHLGTDFLRATRTTPGAYARRCAASREALRSTLIGGVADA